MRPSFIRVFIIFGILVLLSSGCQYFKSTIYSNLDSLVLSKMDDYFDLTDEQMASVRPKVVSHLKWAQQNVIPPLIIELEQLKLQRESINDQQYRHLYQKVVQIWYSIIDRIADDSAWLFLMLSPQQFKYLQAELLEQHNERYEPAFSGKAEFSEKWAEFQEPKLDGFIQLVGEITEQQSSIFFQALRQNQSSLKKESNLVSSNRELFFQKTSTFTKQSALAVFFRQWAKKPSAEYEKFRLKRKQKTLLMFSGLERSLTEEQRQFRRASIEEYLSDLKLIKKIKF